MFIHVNYELDADVWDFKLLAVMYFVNTKCEFDGIADQICEKNNMP